MRRQGGFFYLIKIIIILAAVGTGFFYGQKAWASRSILISEVQIGGATANDEFVELYNPTDKVISLDGWKLQTKSATGETWTNRTGSSGLPAVDIYPYSYFLLAAKDYSLSVVPDFRHSANWGLADSGGHVRIIDNSKPEFFEIDKVGYGNANSPEGVAAPATGKSLARKIVNGIMQDTDNNNTDFEIKNPPGPQNSGSPKLMPIGDQANEQNNNATTSEPPPAQNETATSTSATENLSNPSLPMEQKINFGDVVINEFVSDPADNEVEFIELYNKINKEINLTGWRLEDGSKAKTNLSGSLGKYKVVEKPNGNLNNDGDLIVLYDAGGKIIDQVAYGNWPDGNLEDNAPAAPDPESASRKFDGYNTYNNANDFAVTIKPTKGASNIIQVEDEVSAEAKAKFDFSSDIYLSEILPNPAGDDTKLEFIEIYNVGQREVNLTGWSLSNEDDKKINFEKIATSTIIKAGEYLAFFRPRAKIVLYNDQGQVKLFEPLADKPLMVVDYKNVKEGWSYDLVDYKIKGEWDWSETITPGAANVFKTINHSPEVEFSFKSPALMNVPVMFDSSDTADADGDELKHSWDFGDGFKNNLANPEHVYLKIGIYKVKLAVSDGKETGIKEKSIKVVGSIGEMVDVLDSRLPTGQAGLRGNDKIEGVARNGKIIINEIFPNPVGADMGQEWLELKNQSTEQIDLLNWRVENSNGKYKFDNAQLLGAGAFYVLDNAKSKLAFKNTSDVINLYNDLDELADTVEYANAAEGESYARGANGKWFWTTKATPAKENVISLAGSAYAKATADKALMGSVENYAETDLEKIRDLEIGSLVKVKGTVAVEPGVLGIQIFYIVGSPGMQIYNYKKDFPVLRIGDYIEVTGELTQTQGEFRIKTKDKSGINLIEHKVSPVALAIKGDEVSEENIGQLITVSGEITDKKSASLYVDDGSGEIFIYIKQTTGINTKSLIAGQKVSVTGILSKIQTGLRLLPRYQSDIAVAETSGGLEPQVLGEVAAASEWDLAERNKKLELFKYLLIIAGGVIIILAGLFVKLKRKI